MRPPTRLFSKPTLPITIDLTIAREYCDRTVPHEVSRKALRAVTLRDLAVQRIAGKGV
jgi:hypothetical protein